MTVRPCLACQVENPAAHRFCSACGAPLRSAGLGEVGGAPWRDAAENALRVTATIEPERRQVTSMFVDIVGSTRLSTVLDPEEMLEVIQRYQDAIRRIVERLGGQVVKYVGDGVLACFGFPEANEDDPARAVEAALALVEEVRNPVTPYLPTVDDGPLAVRIGVATGLVVVGRAASASAVEAVTIVGEAVNLAARLQDLAAANQIVVAATTHRRLRERFVCSDLGTHMVKGWREPVRLYAVEALAASARRGGLRPAPTSSRLVGRDAELGQLLDCWATARSGAIRLAIVSGDAGIGKSALVRRFLQAAGIGAGEQVRLQCAPQEHETALYPHVVRLEHLAGWQPTDPPSVKLDRLEAVLAPLGAGDPQRVPLLAALSSIPTEPRYPPLAMGPQRQLQRTMETLIAELLAQAERAPLVVVYEDVHWIDPTSLELLRSLVDRRPAVPLLVVLTTRTPAQLPWRYGGGLCRLPLEPVSRADSRDIAYGIAAATPLPSNVVDEIVARADGVPLFVEELTKAMLELGTPGERGGGLQVGASSVPESLQDLLVARLDRLGTAKRVAQVAAALGRAFRLDHLAAVTEPLAREALQDALDRLVSSGLVARRRNQRSVTYVFRHALMQDAAYGTMLRRTRLRLHGRIAEVLVARFPELAESEPQMIARHFTAAGAFGDAARYWLAAGRQSARRGVLGDAIAHYRHGLAAVAELADGPERRDVEFGLHAGLGPALMVMRGPGHPEFGRVQSRALELCRLLDNREALFPLSFGVCVYRWGHAELVAAGRMADELIDQADAAGIDAFVMAANTVGTMVTLHKGELATATARAARVLALYDSTEHRPLYDVFLLDFGVFSSFYATLATLIRGRPDRARAMARETLDLARRVDRPHPYGFGLLANLLTATWCESPEEARRFAETCIDFSTEQGFPEFVALAKIGRAWARSVLEEPAPALAELREGIALWRATGFETWQSGFGVVLARMLAAVGEPEPALAALDEQLERIAANGEMLFASELLSTKADILASIAPDETPVAEALYQRAAATAQAQGARLWELRAVIGQARLLRTRGLAEHAGALLRPVVATFEGGHDLPCVRTALRWSAAHGRDDR